MRDGRRRTAGWALVALVGLWLYLWTVGVDAIVAALGRVDAVDAAALDTAGSPVQMLVVVPVARLAGASPTPGGTASAEALLPGLLVAVGGVAMPVAAAAALVYRAAGFWLPTVGGGVVTTLLLLTAHDSRR